MSTEVLLNFGNPLTVQTGSVSVHFRINTVVNHCKVVIKDVDVLTVDGFLSVLLEVIDVDEEVREGVKDVSVLVVGHICFPFDETIITGLADHVHSRIITNS